jgi:hypothetical protein
LPAARHRIAVSVLAVLTMVGCTAPDTDTSAAGNEMPYSLDGAVPARLILDNELCRNGGTVEAFGTVWSLVDPAPLHWRNAEGRDGVVSRVSDQDARFIADDGTELMVTIGPRPMVCFGW